MNEIRKVFLVRPAYPRAPVRERGIRLALAAAALAALAGCTSSPSRFYTLTPASSAAPAEPAAQPDSLIELAAVNVPPEVARPQFVVQTGGDRMDVLEQTRWASLPGDEIRHALSSDLTQQLHTIDVYGIPHVDTLPVYRISVNVQRFESAPGSHARIDAVWSVRELHTQLVMTCHSTANEPVSDGYDALVDGHRRAVASIATDIANGVRGMMAAAPAHERSKDKPLAVACPQS